VRSRERVYWSSPASVAHGTARAQSNLMMRTTRHFAVSCLYPISLVALLALLPVARAQASETITATAQVKTSSGVAATAPVNITVDRFSTDGERDEILAALKKGGTEGVRSLLLTRPSIGSLKVGNESTAVKYVYARTSGSGRLITAVTGTPIAFVGAAKPGAQPRTGFSLGLVMLELAASGPGQGELVPATKVKLNDQGAIVTEDYSGEVVKLTNVSAK
jgi:hypothetical protein